MLRLGAKKALQLEDLYPLSDHDHAARCTALLQEEWEKELRRRPKNPRFWLVCYLANVGSFWSAAWYCFLESVTRIVQPLLLLYFLRWLEQEDAVGTIAANLTNMTNATSDIANTSLNSNSGTGFGVMLALLLGFTSFIQAHVHHKVYFLGMRGGFNLRLGTIGLLHRKVLRLGSSALLQATTGLAVNLASNDVQRHDNFMPFLHFLWTPMLVVGLNMNMTMATVYCNCV
jgi:hypothetical protein